VSVQRNALKIPAATIARGAIDFPPAKRNLMRGKIARSNPPAQLNFAFTRIKCSVGLPAREAFRSATYRRYSAPASKADFLIAPDDARVLKSVGQRSAEIAELS